MKRKVFLKALGTGLLASTSLAPLAHTLISGGKTMATLPKATLTLETRWDKTFPQDPEVVHEKVTYVNRFGITLAADLYRPKTSPATTLPAIAVSGPFGAVKEQSSGLYAQTLARTGYVTLAFDPSYTGESGGLPRDMASPDINTEDFIASVDFLTQLKGVDEHRIGIIGICGFGGIALATAAVDPRIKATVASTMYDMTRVMQNGYDDAANTPEARDAIRQHIASLRTQWAKTGKLPVGGRNLPEQLKGDEPEFIQRYFAYYRTPRGFHPRSVNSNGGWSPIMPTSFINEPLLAMIGEIKAPVMIVHGEKAHSRYFGETAYRALKGDNKSLVIVPNADHTDLYDNLEKIPFDTIRGFFKTNLV
ncbi:MAG: alpha/beta hydrolase [Sutterella sp.]|nr:alpha/beta hydrolase [Sutterella sp.]